MTDDALLVVETLFTSIWSIFTSWHIPGTNVSPMAAFLFLIVACLGIRLLYIIAGQPNNMSSIADGLALEHRNEEMRKADRLRDARLRDVERKNINRMNDRLRSRELHNSGYYHDR